MGAKEGFSKIDGCNCTHCTPLAAALPIISKFPVLSRALKLQLILLIQITLEKRQPIHKIDCPYSRLIHHVLHKQVETYS